MRDRPPAKIGPDETGTAIGAAVLAAALAALSATPPAQARPRPVEGSDVRQNPAGADEAVAPILARARAGFERPPAPLPHVHTEGTLPGQGIREASIEARRDLRLTLDMAIAWRMTGGRRFLAQAAGYLDEWRKVYRLSLNPIDETWFDRFLLATDLIEPGLSPERRQTLDAYWRQFAQAYLGEAAAKQKQPPNNWQSHRVKLATMAAYHVGDPRLIAGARDIFRAQVAANIDPDGSVFDFHERDALHYVTYDLDPLLMAAVTAKAHGEDWYAWTSPNGSSLKRAVAWLQPYARGDRQHIEFVNSNVRFDRERAAAGQAQFAAHPWNPANAVDTFALAAVCDPALQGFAADLAKRTQREPTDWLRYFVQVWDGPQPAR